MNRSILTALLLMLTLAGIASAQPKTAADPRSVAVEGINPHSSFLVRVDVDHPLRLYKKGELIRINVRSEKAGYLHLFLCDANKKVHCIFPNKYQQDNKIPAGETIVVPGKGSDFRLRVTEPFGWEVIKAVVSQRPLTNLKIEDLIRDETTELSAAQFKGILVEAQDKKGKVPAKDWAEHHVQILTYDPVAATTDIQNILRGVRQPRRYGVFIGVSEFASRDIPKLKVAHHDAHAMAVTMKDRCGLDEALVLVNKEATFVAIEQAIRAWLPSKTRPGDTVFIYWSGHGGRCSNVTGPVGEALQEYLIPHDGDRRVLANTGLSMVKDETFARWLQELDGRRIVVILDACYSGGLSGSRDVDEPNAKAGDDRPFFGNFLDRHLERMKSLGQKDTVLLASSRADEKSFERLEKDYSVMTYFLMDMLKKGDGPLQLAEMYPSIRTRVGDYMKARFPHYRQTPVLVPEDDRTEIRPAPKK